MHHLQRCHRRHPHFPPQPPFVARLDLQNKEHKVKEVFPCGDSGGRAFLELKEGCCSSPQDADGLVFVDWELEQILQGWIPWQLGVDWAGGGNLGS